MAGNRKAVSSSASTFGHVQERFQDAIKALHDDWNAGAAPSGHVSGDGFPLAIDHAGFRYVLTRTPCSGPGSLEALTAREREVAWLVAHSLANKAIGTRLRISATTVSTHLRSVFKKAGVASRHELACLVLGQTPPVALPLPTAR